MTPDINGEHFYALLREGKEILRKRPGQYAGNRRYKIFGLPDGTCCGGKQMKPENRVWFANLEDAVNEGYRPCNLCKPMDEEDWERVKNLVPDCRTLQEFYRKDTGNHRWLHETENEGKNREYQRKIGSNK